MAAVQENPSSGKRKAAILHCSDCLSSCLALLLLSCADLSLILIILLAPTPRLERAPASFTPGLPVSRCRTTRAGPEVTSRTPCVSPTGLVYCLSVASLILCWSRPCELSLYRTAPTRAFLNLLYAAFLTVSLLAFPLFPTSPALHFVDDIPFFSALFFPSDLVLFLQCS